MLAGLWLMLVVGVAQARERVYYFHNDHLGTPQALSDAAGRIVWAAEYEPFGLARVSKDPDGDGIFVINNLRFPGQYYDTETDLHYNYHRYYDPQTGRYLTPDPIGLVGGLNPYRYVRNNPVNFTDPLGLYDEETHFLIAYQAALRMGMPDAYAQEIGMASAAVDAWFDPLLKKNKNYHFSLYSEAQSYLLGAKTLKELGIGIHILMDSFSHKGLTWETAGPAHLSRNPDRCDLSTSRDLRMSQEVEQAIRRFYYSMGTRH